jgi:hypothetical protein
MICSMSLNYVIYVCMGYSSLGYTVLYGSCRIAVNPVVYILDVISRLVPVCLTYCSMGVALFENTRLFVWISWESVCGKVLPISCRP